MLCDTLMVIMLTHVRCTSSHMFAGLHINNLWLQVYTGGVFSPMSEDGSDYQQMDSFQVLFFIHDCCNVDHRVNDFFMQKMKKRSLKDFAATRRETLGKAERRLAAVSQRHLP